jgi:rod shape-determining protein MreD
MRLTTTANVLSLPIMLLAAAIQASFVPQIRLLGGGPDLIFLLVLAWSINADLDSSVVWAFVGGIMIDLLSAAPTGSSVMGLLFLVFATSGIGGQVYQIGFTILVGLVMIGTLVQQVTFMMVISLAGFRVSWLEDFSYIIAPTMLYNLVLIWPVYWFVRRLQRRLDRRSIKS